jgi:GNAT superfamily N-acetyltransferase
MNLLPRLQGAGVGPRLLDAWLQLAALQHPQGVHVGVNRGNARAVTFWSRMGFIELALEKLEPGRTIWMGRRLNPQPA